jgi:hypothetical protein
MVVSFTTNAIGCALPICSQNKNRLGAKRMVLSNLIYGGIYETTRNFKTANV